MERKHRMRGKQEFRLPHRSFEKQYFSIIWQGEGKTNNNVMF